MDSMESIAGLLLASHLCVCAQQALGMRLPEQPLTADSIAAAVGPATKVHTVNVKTQVWMTPGSMMLAVAAGCHCCSALVGTGLRISNDLHQSPSSIRNWQGGALNMTEAPRIDATPQDLMDATSRI